jgi:ketosteroid isomerase-like protein
MPSQVELVRELWRAHEAGGLDAFFAVAGDDVVWQPFLTGNQVFRGSAELRAALTGLAEQGIRYEAQLHDLEQHGNVVLVHGVLRVSDNGRFDETPLHWAYHFRDGRLRRQGTYASREAALTATASASSGCAASSTSSRHPTSSASCCARAPRASAWWSTSPS